ncbi:MAG: NAD-dependent epimerase/dehydratase family protein [Bradymonadaceae bacterium]|nr:NAD-dependent epimerase/dehydratase family protein [Lujinxingiaceae bacterium]
MTPAKILIIGAGYAGLQIAHMAREQGLAVAGTTRSVQTVEQLEAMGAAAVLWDVLEDDVARLKGLLDAETAVIYSVPTLFDAWKPAGGQGLARHVAPVARVLEACAAARVARLIYLSSTSVYGDHGGAWIDESSERRPDSPAGQMRRDIEDCVLGFGDRLDVNVAQLVGIYGPGRTLVAMLESGRYTLVDGGKKVTNRIHVEDIAQAVLAMVERAPGGARTYLLSDGNPQSVAELVDFICEQTGIARPAEESLEDYAKRLQNPNVVARWKNTYRAKNQRMLEELGVRLRYVDALAGYASLLG